MSMKEALEVFFEEMKQNYIKKKGCPPKAVYNEEHNPTGLFKIETLTKDGYAEWTPMLQDKAISFDNIEIDLGFHINEQIKSFFLYTGFCHCKVDCILNHL